MRRLSHRLYPEAMKPTSFVLERDRRVAVVRLNKPETLNSLTFESYRELTDTFRWLGGDDSRAVVVTGTGKGFCSGGGVEDIIAPLLEMTAAEQYRFTRMTCDLIAAIRACRKPVIAAVNGVAAGAGAMIALASDIRIVSEKAKFGFLFVKVGLSGADMGAAWLLPRVVGLGRATELLMTGRMVRADEALACGLANRVTPPDEVVAQAMTLARELASGPRFALAMTKEMLDKEAPMSLEAALEAETQAQALCMATPEFREGYQAFTEKRPPRFDDIDP